MMDKNAVIPVVLVVLVLVIVGVILVNENKKPDTAANASTTGERHGVRTSQNNAGVTDETANNEVQIDIKDFAYTKQNIKIKKGTTVTWTNRDDMQHNVMAEHDDSGTAHDAPSTDHVDPAVLAGPLLAKGESYSFTFNKASDAPYHCSPHPFMKGLVTVVE